MSEMPMPIGHEPVLFSNPNLLETTPDGRYSTFVAEMTPGKVTQEVIDFHTLAQSAFPQMKSWTPEDLVRYPQRIPELMFCIRDGAMMVSAAKVRMFAKFSTVDPLHQPCVLEFNTAATHPDYQARGLMSGLLSNMFRRLPEMIYSLVGKATERTFEAIPNEPYPGLHPFQRQQAILRGLSDAMILVFDTSRVTAKYEYLEMESSRVGAPLRKAILNTATAAGWSPEITVPNTMFKSFAQGSIINSKEGLTTVQFFNGRGATTRKLNEEYFGEHLPIRQNASGIYRDTTDNSYVLLTEAFNEFTTNAQREETGDAVRCTMPGFEATIDHSSGNIQFSGKNAASFVKLLQSKVNFDPYPTQIRMGVQYNWPNGLPS